jgi:hypothetical protein
VAWTTPLTAVTNATLTAAQWNASVRDNLLETGPAKATTSGRLIVTSGVNSVAERVIIQDTVSARQSTTSTSYVDLTTAGPTVTATTGTTSLVFVTGRLENATSAQAALASYEVSGASSVAASDARGIKYEASAANANSRFAIVQFEGSLSAGSNTFTMKYRATGGTAFFQDRVITVIAL